MDHKDPRIKITTIEVSGEQVHRWYSEYLTFRDPEMGVTTFPRWLRHRKTHGRKFELSLDRKHVERSWMRVNCYDDTDAIKLKLKW